MNLLKTIIERLNQRIEVANIFDKQFGLCELNANGNDKAWVHYIGNGQAEVVTNFDAKQGTLFWAKRGKVTVNKTDAYKMSGCKQLYVTSFPLTAYAVVRKSHLPCDADDAQDWLASRIYKLTSGTDSQFKQSIGVINYEVIPSGYINEIKSLTANYEFACVTVDFDVQVITTTEDGCYDICATGDIPLPDFQPCTPCLTEVAVDGVTITGNGTPADPLVAVGGEGGAIAVEEEGVEVTPIATTLNFTGDGVTASLTSPGVVEVKIPGGTGDVGTLQEVTDLGNSTTNDIDFIANAGLSFDNGTFFRKGTTDGGNGGAKGTAQICSLSYELKWEAGRLYYMEQDGFTIRDVTHNFTLVPQVTDDSTKGFVVGSRWSLDDGTVYLCSDDTIGAAVWAVVAVGGVTSVTATAPIASSGGTTPDISISQADGSTDGYLTSTDWSTFNGKFDVPTGTNTDYLDGTGAPTPFPTITNGTVTSVDITMPTAFSVTGNPVTSSGTLVVAAAGLSSQYIRGDGALGVFPTIGGGGGGSVYYLNGNISQGTIGGTAMFQLSKIPNSGAAANFTRATTGTIASFITDAGDPNQLTVPAGVWIFEAYLSETGGGSNHAEINAVVEKWNGATLTVISTGPIEQIVNGNTKDLYQFAVSIPSGVTLTLTDRIVIQIKISNANGKTVTLYTEGVSDSSVTTTFANGISSLNALTAAAQTFGVGTSGTDFGISSATSTHTFNLPTASATNRGALSSSDWSTFNGKQDALVSSTNIKTINSTSVLGTGNITVEPTIAAGTSSQYYRGDKTFQTLDKSAVGLANVDNTSDANKPISTATQTALNGKQATITPAALTKVDDTNVTLTLGGTPTTALLQAASITAGWSGTLADARITSAATWNAKQAALVSGTNIKTINSVSLLGSGDIAIASMGVYKSTTDGAASSAVANTFSQSILVPANSVVAGSVLEFKLRSRKTGANGAYTIRLYANTTNNLSGTPILLATYGGGLAQALGQQLNRTAAVKNATTNTEMLLATTSLATDFANNSFVAISVDWTTAQYIIGTVQNTSALDSSLISLISMTII